MKMRMVVASFLAMLAPALAAQSVGDVLINELCYDSDQNIGTSSGPDYEWAELYNTTASAVDLGGWQLKDNAGTYTLPSGTSIAANGYLIVSLSANSAQFLGYTGWVANVDASPFSSHGIQLGNSGDGFALFTPAGTVQICVDYIQYGSGTAAATLPAYTGTRATDPSNGNDDFAIARIPNGVNADATAGDAGSEQAATSFRVAPFTPGRANGLPVVDCYVPDELSDHDGTGNAIQTLCPRDTTNPLRMTLNLAPSFNLNGTSSFGFSNVIAFRARYHDLAATVSVAFSFNSGQTTLSTSGLTLPANGNMPVVNNLLMLLDVLGGQMPTTTGTIVVDIACTIAAATTTFQLEIELDAPTITTGANLGTVVAGSSTPINLAATGGATPYTWTIAANPAWVTIAASTGVLTVGPPAGQSGISTVEVTVSDSNAPPRTHMVTFNFDVVAPLVITTTSLATIAEGTSPSETIVATGGTAPFMFALVGAPAWLSIGANTGTLAGTAPAGSAGSYNFDVSIADTSNPQQTDTQALTLTVVSGLAITSTSPLASGEETQPYAYTFTAIGGQVPYTWSATGLPAFLGLNPNTGQLSGTPSISQAGTYNFTVQVTDASTPQQNQSLPVTLVINPLTTFGGGGGDDGDDGGGCTVAAAPVLPLLVLLAPFVRRRKES